jgi:hypothetical protein
MEYEKLNPERQEIRLLRILPSLSPSGTAGTDYHIRYALEIVSQE